MDSEYSKSSQGESIGPITDGDFNSIVDSNSPTIRNINIEPLSSGYMVRVGCQTVAIETTDKLVEVLTRYLNDPQGVERAWYARPTRNKLENLF
mgnify:CR=1 FL=1